MQIRRVRVQIDTERLRITGTLRLPTEGYRSRTTDFLNGVEAGFIALTDAEMVPSDGGAAETRPFVAVGCRHIIALAETDDLGIAEEHAGTDGLADYTSPSTPPPGA